MDLIVGATGALGGLIAGRLLASGSPVRALMRESSGSDPQALRAARAEIAIGDLKDPQSLGPACRGVRRVIATATAAARGGADTVEAVDQRGYEALITAAEKAGVEQFVFMSASGFEADAPVALARAKAGTEAALAASDLNYTVLRPVLFMEAWIGFVIGSQLESGPRVQVVGSPDRRYGFVAVGNVADLALAVLGNPKAERATIPLSAGRCSYREIVDWIGAATGRSIDIDQLEPGTEIGGLPPIVNELWSWGARGGMEAIETPEVVERFELAMVPPDEWISEAFRSVSGGHRGS